MQCLWTISISGHSLPCVTGRVARAQRVAHCVRLAIQGLSSILCFEIMSSQTELACSGSTALDSGTFRMLCAQYRSVIWSIFAGLKGQARPGCTARAPHSGVPIGFSAPQFCGRFTIATAASSLAGQKDVFRCMT